MSNLWNIIGHDWAVELLIGHLKRGKPRHAYLITGPANVGRRTLAIKFAQAINEMDSNEPGVFDPDSQDSKRIENMQHPDMSVVVRKPGDRDIKIAGIRELQKQLSLSPYMSKFRFALLLNFEDANNNASNALLKTLEEPASQVVMILTAQSPESLLPTIVSRCEHIRLRPVSVEVLAGELQSRWGISSEDANLYAHISGGRPGLAISYIGNEALLEQRKETLNDLVRMIDSNRTGRFAFAKGMCKDKEKFIETLNLWQSFWRDEMIRKTGALGGISNIDYEIEIDRVADKLTIGEIKDILRGIDISLAAIYSNVNPLLNAETLLLKFPIL
jgi:DNA polymerase-3 subunit delta'